ncbi:MAG: GNAT family N-acetyltransferase [Desulfobacter sp.]|nr:GNAT family N-acetyltransferase [Desulfobacter sp.]
MTYIFKTPTTDQDLEKISTLLNRVFHPEKVGDLARVFSAHLPRMKKENWFAMADPATGDPVSAFALIPWTWAFNGIRLKVAEMGLVGTCESCQGKGLMKQLNTRFDAHVREQGYDLCVIQGIPGFYHHFGFHWAVELEHHVNLPLTLIPDPDIEPKAEKNSTQNTEFQFRRAKVQDVGFLMDQDSVYQENHSLSVHRSKEEWAYLLTHSKATEYGSDFWIMEKENRPCFYARVPFEGFGQGLILSEVSEKISHGGFMALVNFLKTTARAQEKDHIRINLPPASPAGQMAMTMGTVHSRPYAWQIKIWDSTGFLNRIRPALESRLENTMFNNYSGLLRLNLYTESIDLKFVHGKMTIARGDDKETQKTFNIPKDLFPALVLGYKSWQELQHCRPDIFPVNQHLRFKSAIEPDEAGLLMDLLFAPQKSWIYERY